MTRSTTENRRILRALLAACALFSLACHAGGQGAARAQKEQGARDRGTVYAEAVRLALHAARGIQDNDERDGSLAVIAKGQAEAGQPRAGIDTAHEIEDTGLRGQVLRVAAEKLLDEEGVDAARAVAQEIEDSGARAQALRNIAEAQAKDGDTAAAVTTAESIGDPAARAIALSDIAEAAVERGERDAARRLMDRAIQVAAEVPSRAGRAFAVNEIARAEIAVGGMESTRRLFDQARQLAREIPNAVARSRVLYLIGKGRAQTDDISGAYEDVDRLPDPFGRTFVLREIGMEQGGEGNKAEAQKAFRLAAAEAVQIEDAAMRSRLIGKVAEATVDRTGDLDMALAAVEHAPDQAGRDLILSMLIGALAEEEATARAMEIAGEISSAPVRALARIDIAKALAEKGDRDGARSILAAVSREPGIFEGDYRAWLYRDLAEAWAKLGEFDSAFRVAERIELPSELAAAYSAIAEAVPRKGRRGGGPPRDE